jgi:tRNA G18 (ribose-2'-O)-methylase SpoU
VVLVGIANHDNMGGLFRNAAAFGAEAVLLDQTSCDPLYRKALRVSVGAALRVHYARFGSLDDLWRRLAADAVTPIALTPQGREELAEIDACGRVAAVFGAEGPGLPQTILDRCRTIRIQMAAGFDSLNVGAAAGITLHHLQKRGRPRPA